MIATIMATVLLATAQDSGPRYPEIAFEIIAMGMADQEARNRLIEAMQANPESHVMSIAMRDTVREDQRNTARMKEIVTQIGWPTVSKVGKEASSAAWLLVQHADAQPAFQKECLALMRPYFGTGEVSERNYAYLWDRVAMNTGGRQRYGTQISSIGGRWVADKLENPRRVDAYRREVGLGPLAEYIKQIEEVYGPARTGH